MAKAIIPNGELNRFDLPAVCLVTGSEEGVTFRKRKLLWTPPWVYLLIFVPTGGILLALLVSALVRRRVDGELPFTDKGWFRYRLSPWLRLLSVVALIIGVVAAFAFMASGEDALKTRAGIFAVVSLAVPFAVYAATRSWTVRAAHISPTHVDLRIGSEVAQDRITSHLNGRTVRSRTGVLSAARSAA